MVSIGRTCCAPFKITVKDTGAACDGPDHREGYGRGLRWASQSSDAGKHPATSRREIERFIRFLPLINVLPVSFKSVHDPGQRAGQQHRRRRCAQQGNTEQQLRDKGTAVEYLLWASCQTPRPQRGTAPTGGACAGALAQIPLNRLKLKLFA